MLQFNSRIVDKMTSIAKVFFTFKFGKKNETNTIRLFFTNKLEIVLNYYLNQSCRRRLFIKQRFN